MLTHNLAHYKIASRWPSMKLRNDGDYQPTPLDIIYDFAARGYRQSSPRPKALRFIKTMDDVNIPRS